MLKTIARSHVSSPPKTERESISRRGIGRFFLIRIGISHKRNFMIDVHSTNGTTFVGFQPLIHAFDVKQMHARQSPHVFSLFKVRQANGALIRRIFVAFFPRRVGGGILNEASGGGGGGGGGGTSGGG